MAYTETNWVNNSTPAISAANLQKMEHGIADSSNASDFTITEVQRNANNGYQRIGGVWERGDLNSGAERNIIYRVRTAEIAQYPYAITFTVNTGYNGWYETYSGGVTTTFFNHSTEKTIPANTPFRIVIRQDSESTSTPADIDLFSSQIMIKTPIKKEIEANTSLINSVNTTLNNEIANADNNISYSLEELQKYANNGYQRLGGIWERGDISAGTERANNYRARMSEIMSYPYDITIKSNSGYNGWYEVYNSSGDYQNIEVSFSSTSARTISANTYFRAIIRKDSENTSVPADVELFASQVVIETYVQQEINAVGQNLKDLSKEDSRLEYMQYGHITPNSNYMIGGIRLTGEPNPTIKYRIVSSALQHNDKRIYLDIVDKSVGIQYAIFYYNSSDEMITAGNFTINSSTIPANSYYRVTIKYTTEDTSRVLTDAEADKMWNAVGYFTYLKQIVETNIDTEQMVYNLSKGRSDLFEDEYAPLEFIHFSDIHNQPKQWGNICDYMDKYSDKIPFAIHTGDYVTAYQAQYTDLYAFQSPKNGYILNVTGNHDTYETYNPATESDAETVFNLLFNHISNWGVTFGSATNAMYYYKDFASSGIRLIVLDVFYWDETEESWFVNLLEDAKTNDLAVITASHVITSGLPADKRVDCTFTCQDIWTNSGELYLEAVEGLDTLIKNFKTAGGEHICHLCGHFHHDIIGYTDDDILNIAIECATSSPAGWCDSERVYGTKSYDCFNLVAIDRSLHTIRLVRIGNNLDYYGREKNYLCYDYFNKVVIANS